jgi:hypothetical protein
LSRVNSFCREFHINTPQINIIVGFYGETI